MTESIITAKELHKSYADTAVVRGIDFDVQQGQCVGLLGPNGAGKTTTIGMILGNCRVSGGTLQVFGLPVAGNELRIRQRSGVVSQTDDLDPDFTVRENLYIYAGFYNLSRRAVATWVDELLEFVKLTDKANAKVDQLSGGMKRRLSIARALINDPELLVLDEPTTGLDPQVRHLIWERLRQLKQRGKTLLLTTHYMEEAQRLCDRLLIIDDGKIIAAGSPQQLITQHVEEQVIEINQATEALQQTLQRIPEQQHSKIERVGETLYCYTNQPDPLLNWLHSHKVPHFFARPANLEDVFLRLTGHDLRD